MKTVSGKVLTTKTISLSKAAKVLSNFVEAETGASHAVSAYLRRSSASFNDLVQFHKELRASKPDRKIKKYGQESTNNEDPVKYEEKPEENEVARNVEDSVGSDSARKRHKKKKVKKNEGVEREGGESLVIEEGNRKERKKRKSGEIDDGLVVDSADQSSLKKKKKRRKIEGKD